VNGVPRRTEKGTDGEQGFCSMGNPGVLEAQKRFIEHVVAAVNGFDNILFEIANENYYSAEWELELCRYIHDLESRLPRRHLVMPLDLPNHDFGGIKTWKLPDLHANLLKARQVRRPLIFDTDGIGTPVDDVARGAFWTAFCSGGHISYLDDSLQPGTEWKGDERGTRWEPARRQLGVLARFVRRTRFWELEPGDPLVRAGSAYAMASARELVAYLPDGGEVRLDLTGLPKDLTGEWLSPASGDTSAVLGVQGGGAVVLSAPSAADWVLHLTTAADR